QCNHNVGFDIGSAFSCGLASAKSTESRAAASSAEKRFEEIAEAGSAEFELNSAAVATPLIISAFRWLRTPLRRRLKSARSIPISAELVIFFAFLWIAQYFVGFVDFLKFFLGCLLILGHVGMMFARQLAESAANLVFAGSLW